ncbi:MAG: hypothetical protein IPF87_01500 [Gemmatimonadetes bacterium]|nr:hypothetical protein [Gemmatimonadota bacterium]
MLPRLVKGDGIASGGIEVHPAQAFEERRRHQVGDGTVREETIREPAQVVPSRLLLEQRPFALQQPRRARVDRTAQVRQPELLGGRVVTRVFAVHR